MNLICSGASKNITGFIEHAHPVYEIVVVTKGACKTVINHVTYELKRHSILITPPQLPHSTHSDSPYSDLFLQIDGFPIPLQTPIVIHDYSDNLLRTMQTVNALDLQNASQTIPDLLNVLCRLLQEILGSTYKNQSTLSLKTLIEKNVGNAEFSIAKTAQTLGYNHDYLRRVYKSDTGTTPTDYLISLRLQQAQKLLINTNYPISVIAVQCGFSDPYYFSKLFKQKVGISPKQFQQKFSIKVP